VKYGYAQAQSKLIDAEKVLSPEDIQKAKAMADAWKP